MLCVKTRVKSHTGDFSYGGLAEQQKHLSSESKEEKGKGKVEKIETETGRGKEER